MATRKDKKTTDVRAVRLFIPRSTNAGKRSQLALMREQYIDSVRYHLAIGWNHQKLEPGRISLMSLARRQKYFPSKEKFPVPKRKGDVLSGRMESFSREQAQDSINSRKKAMLRDFRIAAWCRKNGNENAVKRFQRRISRNMRSSVCPRIRDVKMELSSKVVKIKKRTTLDDHFVFMFECVWDKEAKERINPSNKFNISIPPNPRTKYWEKRGYKLLSGVLVGDGWIEVRFEKTITPVEGTNVTLAIDQGATALITAALSTGERYASRPNPHGKDLKSIIREIMRKKPGSKSRKRAVKDMANYVRYSVNTMFSYFGMDKGRVKTVILEDLRKMQGTNKFLSLLPFGILRDSLASNCKEYGIKFKFQGNAYRSQRCNSCGYVHAKNRKGKIFLCRQCGHAADADENAVDNHFADIPTISYEKNKGKLANRKEGFFWLSGGIITDVNKFPKKR